MAVMTTGTFPKGLWPGIHKFWGLGYDEHTMQHPALFDIRSSDKAYEEVVEATGFGLAPVKPEGGAISYDTQTQGPTTRFTHVAYALGYIVTYEERKDNLYADLAMGRARALGFSMRTTKEIVAANTYNRAFDPGHTGGDGVELCSTAHPTRSGNQSNEPAVATDFSEAACEDLITQIHDAKNNRGLQIAIRPQSLIVSTALYWEANRVLKSTLQNDSAQNALNVLRSTNALPGGIVMNNYLTDADAWFIRTDAPEGMILFNRDVAGPDEDNDFDTKNWRVARYERYEFGWGDFRGLYGSPGA
jgi:hypothetical protein